MAKRHVEDILYDESIKNKKCDKIKMAYINCRIIIFRAKRVHLGEVKLHFIPG